MEQIDHNEVDKVVTKDSPWHHRRFLIFTLVGILLITLLSILYFIHGIQEDWKESTHSMPASFPENVSDLPSKILDAYDQSSAIITEIGYCYDDDTFLYSITYESILYATQVFYSSDGKEIGANFYGETNSEVDIKVDKLLCKQIASKESEASKASREAYEKKELNMYHSPDYSFSFFKPVETDYVVANQELNEFKIYPGAATSSRIASPVVEISKGDTKGEVDDLSWIRSAVSLDEASLTRLRGRDQKHIFNTYKFTSLSGTKAHYAVVVEHYVYLFSAPLVNASNTNPDLETVFATSWFSNSNLPKVSEPDYKGMIFSVTGEQPTEAVVENVRKLIEFVAPIQGAGLHQVQIVEMSKQIWPAGCSFGKGGKGPRCPQIQQPGYLVTLSILGKTSSWRIGEESGSGSVEN